MIFLLFLFFFFQAEDGIRDLTVTGVQTCALPISLELIYQPIEKVGIYVPGGKASYPSTVLMCAVPARAAGVDRVVMCTPPGKDGRVSPERLVAAREAGVAEGYKKRGG